MNARKHSIVNVLATGVVVVMLLSVGLFWARWLCSMKRADLLPPVARKVDVPLPSFEFRTPGQEDPNARTTRYVEAEMAGPSISYVSLTSLGASHYLAERRPGGPRCDVYRWEPQPDGEMVYYDSSLGLIVYKGIENVRKEDKTHTRRSFAYYAGPEGVGATPEEKLGRFTSPLVDRAVLRPQIVYDRTLRRFFAIDWFDQTVRQGPPLPEDDPHRPVQIRVLWRNSPIVRLSPPSEPRAIAANKSIFLGAFMSTGDRVLVLDASGRIDLLDPQTLEFAGVAGRLASPKALFGSPRSTRPEDVISYCVVPMGVPRGDTGQERAYGGCAVATISREAIGMRLDVYDPNGQFVSSDQTGLPQYAEGARREIVQGGSISATTAAYSYLPGAQLLTLAQFTLESLHPPVFLLLSCVAAPNLDATAGYRSVFLLPDSFIAMSARDESAGVIEWVARGFLLGFPAVLLSLWLAWRVTRDGARMGLSKDARAAWVGGTLVFGLSAYLTYRLTRPKVTLVTCQNCGQCRRPDLEKCHRCGSPWVVPELIPPAWRVLGESGWETPKTPPGAAVLQDQPNKER